MVNNINNHSSNNNYLTNFNNNFSWDASHDYTIHDDYDGDYFCEIEDILCGGLDVSQTCEKVPDMSQTCEKVPDVSQTCEKVLDLSLIQI